LSGPKVLVVAVAAFLIAMNLMAPPALVTGGQAQPDYGRVAVQGSDIVIDGQKARFFGAVDTTALQFAIMAYINGETVVAGKSSLFNGPDTVEGDVYRMAQRDSPEEFWHQYFALLEYYGLNLVRLGAGDTWGTGLQYRAWQDHRAEYLDMLDIILTQAEQHHVYVVLVLAGSQEYPTYQFDSDGSVFTPGSGAFDNYVKYCREVMAALEGYDGLGWFDMFNEPDHDKCSANFWNGDKQRFSEWAKAVASATAGASTHPRTMGVAGLGALFGWGQEDFDLATGKTGFEIAHRHYYASSNDANLFSEPEGWAEADNVPLFWGELGLNNVYPLTRWTYAEEQVWASGGQAITVMVLTGTPGYPYTGGTLPDPEPAASAPAEGGSGGQDGGSSDAPAQEPPLVEEVPAGTAAAPRITSSPSTGAQVGALYEYRVEVDSEATLVMGTNATFLTLDKSTGTLSGVPDAPGSYRVIVMAIGQGGSDVQRFWLTVSPAPEAADEPASDVPDAEAGQPLEPETPAESSQWKFAVALEGYLNIRWDFGDGHSAEGEAVQHVYADGEYVVSVTAKGADGSEVTSSMGLSATSLKAPSQAAERGQGGSSSLGAAACLLAAMLFLAIGLRRR